MSVKGKHKNIEGFRVTFTNEKPSEKRIKSLLKKTFSLGKFNFQCSSMNPRKLRDFHSRIECNFRPQTYY